jgi:hypothetical protein
MLTQTAMLGIQNRKNGYLRISFDTIDGKLDIHKQIKINIK